MELSYAGIIQVVNRLKRRISKQPNLIYAQSFQEMFDATTSGNQSVVLYGEAVMSSFQAGASKDDVIKSRQRLTIDPLYLLQDTRFPNDSVGTILFSFWKKNNDALYYSVKRELVDYAVKHKIKMVTLFNDALVSYIKEYYGHRNVVCYSCSQVKEQNKYIIEDFTFSKGRLMEYEEHSIHHQYSTDYITALAELIRADKRELVSASTYYIVTGVHNFTDEQLRKLLIMIGVADEQGIVNPVETLRKGGVAEYDDVILIPTSEIPLGRPIATKEKHSYGYIFLPLVLLVVGVLGFTGMLNLGYGEYMRAIQGYEVSVSEIENIYSKGGSPIQLVTNRQYYMEELETAPNDISNKTERAFKAISALRKEFAQYDPQFIEFIYDEQKKISVQNQEQLFEYQITVSFKSKGEDLLDLGKRIHTALSKYIGASSSSNTLPKKYSDEGEGVRYSITFAGNYEDGV